MSSRRSFIRSTVDLFRCSLPTENGSRLSLVVPHRTSHSDRLLSPTSLSATDGFTRLARNCSQLIFLVLFPEDEQAQFTKCLSLGLVVGRHHQPADKLHGSSASTDRNGRRLFPRLSESLSFQRVLGRILSYFPDLDHSSVDVRTINIDFSAVEVSFSVHTKASQALNLGFGLSRVPVVFLSFIQFKRHRPGERLSHK